MKRLLSLSIACWWLASVTARAQALPTDRPAGGEANVEDESVFDQLLNTASRREPWLNVSSDTRVFHSSNIQLLPDTFFFPQESDTVVAQTFDLRLRQRLLPDLTGELILNHQLVRYDHHDELDFNSQSAGFLLTGNVANWFTVQAGFSAMRDYYDRHNDEFFKMSDTQFGLWRNFPLCRHATFFTGYQLDWRPSSPSALSRVDNTLYAGLTLALLDRLTAQTLYRLSLQESTQIDRFDVNQLVGLTVFYAINNYIRLEAFVNYTTNNSDIVTRDYEVWDAGGALRLTFRY